MWQSDAGGDGHQQDLGALVILQQVDEMDDVLNKMKGLWRYFSLSFENCGKSIKKITKTHHPDQYSERVNQFFDTEAHLRQ